MSHTFEKARYYMVEQQIRPLGVKNEQLLQIMAEMPREWFVPEALAGLAYADTFIPIAEGQKLLSPSLVARIVEACMPASHERVLQVGCGTGYLTALLAKMVKQVDAIELFPSLITTAKAPMTQAKLKNVFFIEGDALEPGRIEGHYDVIILTGAVDKIPTFFKEALTGQGRLFAMVGDNPTVAALYSKKTDSTQRLFETSVERLMNARAPQEVFVF